MNSIISKLTSLFRINREAQIKYVISAQSDVGKRRANNEDNLCVNDAYMLPTHNGKWKVRKEAPVCVAAVCDGMGGDEYGEFASLCAVLSIASIYKDILNASDIEQPEIVNGTIKKINSQICDEMDRRNARIGSTIAMMCIKSGTANIYNIGDSRIYMLRDGALIQLSKDHTLTQQKLDMGAITAEQAKHDAERHTLTQNLGVFESEMIINAHHVQEQVQADDMFLICSDGLTDMVSDEDIKQIMTTEVKGDDIVGNLVEAALRNGGKDNVSVIVITVLPPRQA